MTYLKSHSSLNRGFWKQEMWRWNRKWKLIIQSWLEIRSSTRMSPFKGPFFCCPNNLQSALWGPPRVSWPFVSRAHKVKAISVTTLSHYLAFKSAILSLVYSRALVQYQRTSTIIWGENIKYSRLQPCIWKTTDHKDQEQKQMWDSSCLPWKR